MLSLFHAHTMLKTSSRKLQGVHFKKVKYICTSERSIAKPVSDGADVVADDERLMKTVVVESTTGFICLLVDVVVEVVV